MTGSGYEFDLVILLYCLKSAQNLFDPSFLSTMTTGNDHGDQLLRLCLHLTFHLWPCL